MNKPLQVTGLYGERLEVYTLDFETYYNTKSGYTLRKMSAIEYIRHDEFKAHGCAVIPPLGSAYWVPANSLESFFNNINWLEYAILCHNTAFDGLILSERYNVIPKYYLDTMSMSRGEWGPGVSASLANVAKRLLLEGKLVGELEKTDGIKNLSNEQEEALSLYAIKDAEQTKLIFEQLYFDRGYPEAELHAIDITVRMVARPLLWVDAALCRAEIEEEDLKLKALLNSNIVGISNLSEACAKKLADKGVSGLVRSRDCFAELLLSRGVIPPQKERLKDGKPVLGETTYAFAKNDIELINLGNDPRVSDLVALWSGLKSTLKRTRAQKFLNVTHEGTKTLPIPLLYCGGRTHRWSGSDSINPQNLSSGRDGQGTRLRSAIQAPKGYVLVRSDLSQIELRCIAWLAQEEDLLDDLKKGNDPYIKLASEIFRVPVTKDGPYAHYRHVGKEGELSLGFGVGATKFYNTILTKYGFSTETFSQEDAKRTVEYYRNKRIGIINLWNDIRTFLRLMATREAGFSYKIFNIENERIQMPNGLFIYYNNLHLHYDKDKKQYSYIYKFKNIWTIIYAAKIVENLVQSMARSIIAEHMVTIAKVYPIVLQVHDEIICCVPQQEAQQALDFCLATMRIAPSWCAELPLDAEGSYKQTFSK